MTSRTGRKRRREPRVGLFPPRRRPRRAARPPGVTLLEMLLALGLLTLLSALAVMNLAALRRSRDLQEGLARMESLLRMARADAANQGRRIRLRFDADGGVPRILWEPEPLTAPEQFIDYADCTWTEFVPSDLVRVERCARTADSAYQTVGPALSAGGRDEAVLDDLTFYPDGSSDSAVLELTAPGDEDGCRALVELDGVNGVVTSRILTPTEWEDYLQGEGAP